MAVTKTKTSSRKRRIVITLPEETIEALEHRAQQIGSTKSLVISLLAQQELDPGISASRQMPVASSRERHDYSFGELSSAMAGDAVNPSEQAALYDRFREIGNVLCGLLIREETALRLEGNHFASEARYEEYLKVRRMMRQTSSLDWDSINRLMREWQSRIDKWESSDE